MYTDKQLLNKLKLYAIELGRNPGKIDIDNNPNMPHSSTYLERFGGVNQSLKLIGLTPNRYEDLSMAYFIDLVKQFYEENGIAPIASDFDDNKKYPHSSFVREMGYTWVELLTMSGIPTYSRGINWIRNREAELIIGKMFRNNVTFKDLKENRSNAGSFIINNKFIRVRTSQIYTHHGKIIDSYYWKFKLHRVDSVHVDYYICVGENMEGILESYVFPTGEINIKECISININKQDYSKYHKYKVDISALSTYQF